MIEAKKNNTFEEIDEIKHIEVFESDNQAIFKSDGENLKNYRIYGQTIDGESVGDLVTDTQDEHYGEYVLPVTVTNGADTLDTCIYLPEQIRKVGSEAEYIDFGQQKQHFADGTSVDVTLPALPTLSGTNTLTVGTEVQPSKVWGRLSDPRNILYVKDNLGNILFSKYHEVENVPPLTYKAIEGALKNYRIYGNTENGQSVGDKTANFFNGSWQSGGINSDGYETTNGKRVRSPLCKIVSQKTYTLNSNLYIATVYGFHHDGSTLTRKAPLYYSSTGATPVTIDVPIDVNYIRVALKTVANTTITPSDVKWFMLNEGSTALPYEPYGYKIPVAVNEQTTNIYLDEPLTKQGDNADYIDYATQKRHNSDGTESSVTLPEISTFAGTNTLSVGTTVQPSKIEVVGRIKKL